ncbi:MAG TPA: acetylxylan esterase, partial [Planctomycetota bacterium]|nr:acetylxylan esterase [Planctomycetota bacterium]
EMILSRGYALVTAFYGDLASDRPEVLGSETFAALGQGAERAGDGFGAIALWAWSLSRALDALATVPAIDARRVAVVGLSRLGKVALWAGATDQRFALTISTNSGQGGAALGRRRFGETIRHITAAFPHWFCPDHATWADREDELPVDQHELLALIAPRPVYVASATRDLWADPRGEFLTCVHADPVYRLLGTGGIGGASEMPPPGIAIGDAIGYHLRAGVHSLVAEDWWHYLAFADRWLAPR